jgi:negative regulator of sigma E activity
MLATAIQGGIMANTELTTALTAAAGVVVAAVTGVLSYRGARWNVRKDLEVDLRRERLKAFKELWSLLEPLAKYARPDPVTAASMRRLAAELRTGTSHRAGCSSPTSLATPISHSKTPLKW